MRRPRLLWQFYFPIVLILVTVMAGATWYASEAMRAFFLEQTRADLTIRAELLAKLVSPLWEHNDLQQLNNFCRRTGTESSTRITLIDEGGQVIADSVENPSLMDNHADRLEVIDGMAGRIGTAIRFSQTLRKRMLYLALPLDFTLAEKDKRRGILRLSIPITAIDQALNALMLKIIAGALLLVTLAALVMLSVSRKITHPMEQMRGAAERFADGDLGKSILFGNEKSISREVADLAIALNRMAAQLNERLHTVTGQRNELEAVFASMTDAVLVVDCDEKIIQLNQAARHLLTIDHNSATGRPILEVIRNNELLHFVRRSLGAGTRIEDEINLREKQGIAFYQAHGTYLRDATGEGVGALIVLNNITRLRQLENMRRDFVANVSHELRTPITAIKGFVETLQDGAISCPEDAERFLAIICRHANRLNAIVDDLLTLSRIEQDDSAGEVDLAPTPIKQVLTNTLETCAGRAQEKNITLAVECQESLIAQLNEPLMEQAITNLVVNAIKYSHENSEVRVTATRFKDWIRITVADCGVGIDNEHLPRLFERFYRSDKARSRKLGGTGLGLAIVKHIVQAHNGTVNVNSTPGKGTLFSIELPA